jgi:hypothetical protein
MKKGLHKCTMKNEYMLYEYIHSNPHLAPTEVREQKFAITCSMCIDCHKFRWTNSGAILALDTRVYAYKYKYIYVCVCVCVCMCVCRHFSLELNRVQFPTYARVPFRKLFQNPKSALSRHWPHPHSFITCQRLCIRFYNVSVHLK